MADKTKKLQYRLNFSYADVLEASKILAFYRLRNLIAVNKKNTLDGCYIVK